MPRFRGSFSGRSRAPRRQILNFANTGEVDGLVSVVGIAKAVGSTGIAFTEGALTLVRTRGIVQTGIAAVAARGIDRIVMGIIVVSSDAFGIGATALPGPISDGENDWIVWTPLMNVHGTVAAEDNQFVDRQLIDSRGMRKLKLGDVLAVMFEIESDVAGTTWDIGYSFRQQFKN